MGSGQGHGRAGEVVPPEGLLAQDPLAHAPFLEVGHQVEDRPAGELRVGEVERRDEPARGRRPEGSVLVVIPAAGGFPVPTTRQVPDAKMGPGHVLGAGGNCGVTIVKR